MHFPKLVFVQGGFMEELNVRKAVLSDVAKVTDCVCSAYQKYVLRIGKKPSPMSDDYHFLIESGHVYIGEYAGEVVSVLVLKDFDSFILLDNVAVLTRFQGRGFGKKMIDYAERYVYEKGVREIRLYTNATMTENIRMYKKLGYTAYDDRYEAGYHRIYFSKTL
jgi:GNAT superfamily N-acetyltransferase